MTSTPSSDEELSQARFASMHKAARRSRQIGVVAVVTVALLVAIVSSAVSVWNTTELHRITADTRQLLENDVATNVARQIEIALAKQEKEFGTPSLRCLLEQLSEHRHLNALAHRTDASSHGYSYPIPPGEEPPPVSRAATVCQQFLPEEGDPNP